MTIPRAVVTAFPPLALASRTGSSCTSVSGLIRPVRKYRPYGNRSRVRGRPIIHVQGTSRYPLIWGGEAGLWALDFGLWDALGSRWDLGVVGSWQLAVGSWQLGDASEYV